MTVPTHNMMGRSARATLEEHLVELDTWAKSLADDLDRARVRIATLCNETSRLEERAGQLEEHVHFLEAICSQRRVREMEGSM